MNVSNKPLLWAIDISHDNESAMKTFQFIHPASKKHIIPHQPNDPGCLDPGASFGIGVLCHSCKSHELIHHDCSIASVVQPGSLDVSLPLYLNESLSPYCELTLTVNVPFGYITVNPSHIVIEPVPLGITVSGDFLIVLDGFARYLEY